MRTLAKKLSLLAAVGMTLGLVSQAHAQSATQGVNTLSVTEPLYIGANQTVYMTISTNGNITLGSTASPGGVVTLVDPMVFANNTKLQFDNASNKPDGYLYEDASNNLDLGVTVSNAPVTLLYMNASNQQIMVGAGASSSDPGANVAGVALVVNGQTSLDGDVGIGVAPSSQYALDVATSAIHSGAYYHGSDVRLKTDIKPLNHALDKLLSLQGISFNWKQTGRADMGLSAQNVKEVYPDIVSQGPDGMLSVEYDSMVGPMIEAIRELKVENDHLAAQNAKLEAEVVGIKRKLDTTQP